MLNLIRNGEQINNDEVRELPENYKQEDRPMQPNGDLQNLSFITQEIEEMILQCRTG